MPSQPFIKPEIIDPTGAIAGAAVTAMVKTPRNRQFVVLYDNRKPDESAYSVHNVEHDDKSLCNGLYSQSFTNAMIELAQRAANTPNILLVD